MTQYEKQFYETIIRELPKISKSLDNIQILLHNNSNTIFKIRELVDNERQKKDID